MILVYNILMISGLILILPLIIPVLFKFKKTEKQSQIPPWGCAKRIFPGKNVPRIWVHALSVGAGHICRSLSGSSLHKNFPDVKSYIPQQPLQELKQRLI